MALSRTASVFFPEHYAWKSFADFRVAFINACPDKVSNKTTIRRLVTCFSVTIAHRVTKQLKLRPYRFQTVYWL